MNLRDSPALAVSRLLGGGGPVVECSVGSCLSVDPCFTCRLVGRSCGNLLLRVRGSDCGKRVAVFRQLESLECGAPLFAVGFLFRGFLIGQGAGFEHLGEVFVSFAFGVAGHCLRCSWCCLVGTAIHYYLAIYFNFPIIYCQQKIQCGYCVTGHNLEEDIIWRPHGQSIYPDGGKTLYIGNREMSDKSRNRF